MLARFGPSPFAILSVLIAAVWISQSVVDMRASGTDDRVASTDAKPSTREFAIDSMRPPAPKRARVDLILARPIFSPTRRPLDAAEVQVDVVATTIEAPEIEIVAPLEPPKIVLLGTLLDGERRALVAYGEEFVEHWISVGYDFDGWVITKIEPNGIQLEAGEASRIITMER